METKAFHVSRAGISGSLVGGILGAPIIWAIHLQLVYMLVKHAQRSGSYAMLHIVTAACLILAGSCGVLSWADWRRVRLASLESPHDGRCHFMAVLGMLSSALFALVILATGLAVFFFNANWE